MIKIIVCGATGRMGTLICQLARDSKDFLLAGKANSRNSLGKCIEQGDVVIDFSLPQAAKENINTAARFKKPLVIGTTGLGAEEEACLKETAAIIPIVASPNTSIGIHLLFKMIQQATEKLRDDFSIRISETHHIHKKDKPSGTAKKMGDIVKKMLGKTPPIESKRKGEVIGEHTIVFESPWETLQLSHSAHDRKTFAFGALKAAKWVLGKQPGLYTMFDVLLDSANSTSLLRGLQSRP